jgi:hypothetical protein
VLWFGLLAPTGTPNDVLDKLHGQTVKALAMPEVRKKFDDLGLEPVGNTPAEFTAIIKKETPEWAKVIKDAGIKLGKLGLRPNTLDDCRRFAICRADRSRANGLFRRAVSGTKQTTTTSNSYPTSRGRFHIY